MRPLAMATTVLLAACTQLPEGWEDAEPITITQSTCLGSVPGASENEHVEISRNDGLLEIRYREAHFRCDQAVEGFLKRSDKRIELLFQPEDMDPSAVARCDCKYDLTTTVPADAGDMTLAVSRRWDNVGGENAPVVIRDAPLSSP